MLCRLGFLLFAFAPTILILSGWFWSIMPWSQSWTARGWEKTISLNMGVDVRFKSMASYAPSSYRFYDVRVRHPETGDLIASIPTVELQHRQATWHIRLQSPRVELAQATQLVNAIHQRYLCQPNLAFSTTTCSIRELTLANQSPSMEPLYLEARFQCHKDKTRLEAFFDLSHDYGEKSARISIERLHDLSSPQTICFLRTAGVKIPCTVLAVFHSFATRLGPEAFFKGDIQCEQEAFDTRLTLAGIFYDVMWNQPHDTTTPPLLGNGQIRVDFAESLNGRLTNVSGLVTAGNGWNSDLEQWLASASQTQSPVQSANHIDTSTQHR